MTITTISSLIRFTMSTSDDLFQLEAKESKLSSSMNSIKTFWSPELKKERALRKDEASKMSMWKEQYRVVQDETQVSSFSSISPLGGFFFPPHLLLTG